MKAVGPSLPMKGTSLFLLLIKSQIAFGALISALDHRKYMYAGSLEHASESNFKENLFI